MSQPACGEIPSYALCLPRAIPYRQYQLLPSSFCLFFSESNVCAISLKVRVYKYNFTYKVVEVVWEMPESSIVLKLSQTLGTENDWR